MARVASSTATIKIGLMLVMVARILAIVWLLPAIFVNVDWAKGPLDPWNLGAVGSILASALFIEGSRHAKSWLLTPVLLIGGLFLVYTNLQVAFDNATIHSDHSRDDRKQAIIAAKKASSQRSQLSQGRAAAAETAGETPSTAYEADIQQAIARDAKRWAATGECDPLKTTAGQSMKYCSDIAALRSKKAQAETRERLDREIGLLDSKTENMPAVTSADPFADNIAELLLAFGIHISDDVKAALPAQKNASRALALELVAAFGPMAWLLLIDALVGGARAARTLTPQTPEPRRKPEKPAFLASSQNVATSQLDGANSNSVPSVQQPVPAVPLDDPFHQFVSDDLEDCPGVYMKAAEPWLLWSKWCSARGISPGSQRAFGMKMGAVFAKDQNNNRPRYLNVRQKRPVPKLVVANG